MIEVLDLRTGDVLAQGRFGGLWGGFMRDQHVLAPEAGGGGEQRFRILQLRLHRPG